MAAALLPMLAMGVPAVLSGISSIMEMVHTGKQLRGGRLGKKRSAHKKRRHQRGGKLVLSPLEKKTKAASKKRAGYELRKLRTLQKNVRALRTKGMGLYSKRGKGVVSDTLGKIPLLGMLLGPIASALGGKIRRTAGSRLKRRVLRKGRGLAPMKIHKYIGGMLTAPGGTMAVYQKRLPILPNSGMKSYSVNKIQGGTTYRPNLIPPDSMTHFGKYLVGGKIILRKGHYRNINGNRIRIKPVGGLLSPAGGSIRKGHYRYVKGKRIHVKPAIVGRGLYLQKVHKITKGKKYKTGLRSGKKTRNTAKTRLGGYIPYTWKSKQLLLRNY